MSKLPLHDPGCHACPRLAAFLDDTLRANPGYFCRPVPPFGPLAPRLLIVGLAPGMHGANRTGRPFTGDYAGLLLYETLHAFGFSSAAQSESATDGLKLIDARITNAVKCLPPQNKPATAEVRNCNGFLAAELAALRPGAAVLALGAVSHGAVLRALDLKAGAARFAHGARHALPNGCTLFDSYHCSRYNTNTRRLTPQMFRDVFHAIRAHLGPA
ncbi:MAG: uracil-DNA glycosylase [Betaproteobacteria bacterium]|nr:uracil-DNA glycosylase [Betaproteobacteria bacterium]